jgi:hypothetical protein
MDAIRRFSGPNDAMDAPLVQGVLAGTMVRTLDGILPVEYLGEGDRIVTRSGARRLVSVLVTVRRQMDLIRIRASTLGHDRPEQDLLLAPETAVVIQDWRAKALYGVPMAAVPAARLADGLHVVAETHRDVRLFALRFDTDEVIFAEGLQLACPCTADEPQPL